MIPKEQAYHTLGNLVERFHEQLHVIKSRSIKIKKIKWLVVLLLLSQSNLFAQLDSSLNINSRDTIRISSKVYYLGSKKISPTKLGPILSTYQPAAIEYKKYYNKAGTGGLIILASITSGILALTKIRKQSHFWTPYTVTQFGLMAIGIPIVTSAQRHLKKAVRLYNFHMLHVELEGQLIQMKR